MAIIRDGAIHQLVGNGSIQLIIYLEKDSQYARQLKERYLVEKNLATVQNRYISKLTGSFFRKIIAEKDCQVLFHGCQFIINELLDLDEQPIKIAVWTKRPTSLLLPDDGTSK